MRSFGGSANDESASIRVSDVVVFVVEITSDCLVKNLVGVFILLFFWSVPGGGCFSLGGDGE
jgi:hypothetical protein